MQARQNGAKSTKTVINAIRSSPGPRPLAPRGGRAVAFVLFVPLFTATYGCIEMGPAVPPDSGLTDKAASVSPENCDTDAWESQALGRFKASGPVDPAPPPDDELCHIITIDKHCKTVCDCKYVAYACSYTAANVAEPTLPWGSISEEYILERCGSDSCEGYASPRPNSTLECRDGTCLVIDPSAPWIH